MDSNETIEIINDDIPLADNIPEDIPVEEIPVISEGHRTREDWLTAAMDSLRPRFAAAGITLASNIRVGCGFPSTASRSGAVGECWADTASRDRTVEILISPVLDDPTEILAVLIAQMAHAAPGALNTGASYRAAAQAMGLEPLRADWKATRGDSGFADRYGALLGQLGLYPHAALVPTGMKQKQSTRLLKVQCLNQWVNPVTGVTEEHGYTMRITGKWVQQGLPTCICGARFTLAAE